MDCQTGLLKHWLAFALQCLSDLRDDLRDADVWVSNDSCEFGIREVLCDRYSTLCPCRFGGCGQHDGRRHVEAAAKTCQGLLDRFENSRMERLTVNSL